MKWRRKAAEQGHERAYNNLGSAYRDGRGAAQDADEAAKRRRKAAAQGVHEAKKALEQIEGAENP